MFWSPHNNSRQVYFSETTDPVLLQIVNNYFELGLGIFGFNASYAAIITWSDNDSGTGNEFQLVLVTNGSDTHAIHLYQYINYYDTVIDIDPDGLDPSNLTSTSNVNNDSCYDGIFTYANFLSSTNLQSVGGENDFTK